MKIFGFNWFQLPQVTLNEQLSNVLTGDSEIPESILLINTSEWQGQVSYHLINGTLSHEYHLIRVGFFSCN